MNISGKSYCGIRNRAQNLLFCSVSQLEPLSSSVFVSEFTRPSKILPYGYRTVLIVFTERINKYATNSVAADYKICPLFDKSRYYLHNMKLSTLPYCRLVTCLNSLSENNPTIQPAVPPAASLSAAALVTVSPRLDHFNWFLHFLYR